MMPTFNGEAFIAEQLDSLLNQQGVELHVYAFDDGSTDKTVSILEDYARTNPGVFSIFSGGENSGGTGLNIFQNIGQVPNTDDYVAFADQDDVWMPDKLIRAIKVMAAQEAGLYFSNLLSWDGDATILGVVKKDAPLNTRDHLFGGGSAGCTYVMTRGFFQHLVEIIGQTDLGGVKRISHDWIIYFVARHYGFDVAASSDALIKYRIHQNSQYGAMSLGGIGAVLRKVGMLRDGFMKAQVVNALKFCREGSEDQAILLAYQRGWISRLSVLLRYNFTLTRKKSRFFLLLLTSVLSIGS